MIGPRARTGLFPAAILSLVVAGCATAGDTAAQQLAWERWNTCNHFRTVRLTEIRPDGQIWVEYTAPSDAPAWQECMRKAAEEQAARRPGR